MRKICSLLLLFSLVLSQLTFAASSDELKVTDTFPASGGQGVFLSSGIEITFNTGDVSEEAFQEAVTLSPEVDFYVAHGESANTLVLSPYGEYQPETQYTVTIKAGLKSESGMTLPSDVSFTFTTASVEVARYYQETIIAPAGQGSVINALTDEIPAFFLLINQELAGLYSGGVPEAEVSLFRFEKDEDFAMSLARKLKGTTSRITGKDKDPSLGKGIVPETTFTVKAEEASDGPSYWWWNMREYVISFPEALPEGRYLARLDFPVKTDTREFTVTKYALIQSTELSTFVMSSGTDSVAWLHNGVTGEALEGAQISLYNSSGYQSGETLADGTAKLSSGPVKDAIDAKKISEAFLKQQLPYGYRLLDIQAGEHSFIEAISDNVLYSGYYDYYGGQLSRDFYTYIYTDRQLYSTTDEVNFFGVLRPRRPDTEIPAKLKVTLGQGWWSQEEIASVEVEPDEHGYFSGTVSFEDQQAAYSASLMVTDESENFVMQSDYFSIEDFVKPTYTYKTEADKTVYVLGNGRDENAKVNIDISYFDETPAAGFGLEPEWCDTGLIQSEDTLTADKKGHIEETVGLKAESFPNTWRPQFVTVNYQSADIEDEKLYISQELVVIPRDVMLYAENDSENKTLKVSTYAIDVSGIQEQKDLYDTENLKGEGISAQVTGELHKTWYEKISDGIRYDHIYKRSYEAYHYDYHDDIVETVTIDTENGEGSWTYDIEQDEANPACYYMKLSVNDSADRKVETTAGISYRSLARYSNYVQGQDVYRLKPITESKEEIPEDPSFWAWYYEPDSKFSEKEPAQFVLVRNEEEFEMPEGSELLSATVFRGFSNIEAGTSAQRSVEFSEDLLPNYNMVGAYFDGKNVWPLTTTSMAFDYETRRLDLKLTPDKEKYLPGEEATVTAEILRADSQTPVPEGTRVVLSIVDEAVFALREQEIQVLSKLYGTFSISYSVYSSRNTQTPSESADGTDKYAVEEAETTAAADMDNRAYAAPMPAGGQMETEHIRSDFRDTAFFATASADAQGKAVFTFTVPDNMTSWRLSAIAVTEDVWAGKQTQDIICTSPYYTVPVINDVMLAGENFAIGLRSAGTLEAPGECSYEVTVRPADEDTVLLSGTATAASLRDYAWVVLEGLEEGSYMVRIKGSCGEYTDVSEYPFTVVRSGLEAFAAKSGPVSEISEIHPLRYPVEVMIYDKDAFVYNAVLSDLLCSREIRADERLGRHFALTILAQSDSPYFEEALEDHDISDLRYIFPQFAYAKNNAEISALAYLAAPEIIENAPVSGVTPENIAQGMESPYTGSPYAAYLLQALAGDEFTADPAELMNKEDISFRDRIYLMAALFTSGDEETAAAAYEQYVTPYLESSEAVSGEVVYYLNADEDTTVQDDTAAALIMASLLHKEEARGMALYLIQKPSEMNIYPLEEVLYLKNCEEKDNESCTVSYTVNGETVTETLTRNRRICLNLQKKALEELNLTAVSGEPYMTVFYIAGMDELTDESTMKLTASVTTDKEVYQPGDEAQITVTPGIGSLDPSIGCSTMILDVIIPSGMRFERYTPDSHPGSHWYLISREGQRLRFVIYDGSEDHSGAFTPVTFTASCVTPGEYIVEKAYLSSNHYDTWGMSERGSVTISAEK